MVESRYDAQSLPQNNFDYTNFFDFGFFSNMAANFAGAPHPSTQPKQTNEQNYVFNIQKQLDPNTVYLHKTIIPRRQAPASEVLCDNRYQIRTQKHFNTCTKAPLISLLTIILTILILFCLRR